MGNQSKENRCIPQRMHKPTKQTETTHHIDDRIYDIAQWRINNHKKRHLIRYIFYVL